MAVKTNAVKKETVQEFKSRLVDNPRPVVVDFWAPWCGPCRAIAPALKRIGETYAGQVDVWKVNADEQPDLLRAYGIFGIPTLMAFRGGQEVARKVGAPSAQGLDGLFQAALNGPEVAAQAQTGGDAAMSSSARLLRLGLATALVFYALTGGVSGLDWLVLGLAALVLFSAVHDRCPVWQAIKPRLQRLVGGNEAEPEHRP